MARRLRPTARLVGRDEELATIARAIDEHRLVTLWGPPGVGKTRLASELVEQRAADPEAVPHLFWDVTPAQSAAHVCAIIAQGLELELGTEPGSTEQLGRLLAERGPLVIVLDNFDQVAHVACDALAGWIEQAPDTSWLITSRERLGLDHEHVIEVKPLSPTAGVELFAARARVVDPGFALTAQTQAHIARLVEQLDNLPLAIELCACRAGVLSPEELVQELSRGIELLTAPARSAFGGLRGLGEAIGSSWAALEPWERSALEQCSAFVGAFSAHAATAVVDLTPFDRTPPLFDVIQSLVDRSLLAPIEPGGSGGRRFQMLLCIAEFARGRLAASGARAEVYRRHAAHFLRLGRSWSERTLALQDLDARRELEQARDELLAIHQRAQDGELPPARAVEAALALLPWYRRFGPYSVLLDVLDRALAIAPDLEPVVRSKALGARGSTLRLLGRLDEAEEELTRAAALIAEPELSLLGGLLESELAQTDLDRGNHVEAQSRQERVLAAYRRHQQRVLEGHALLALGNMHFYVDDLEAAQRSYEQALAVHRAVDDRIYECETLRSLALVELELGRRGSARAHFEEALEAIERVNERRWRPVTLGYFAILEQEEGNQRRATSLYSEAIAEARWVGRWRHEAMFRGYLGTCLLEQGALDEARAALLRAIDDLGAFERMASRALFRGCIAVVDAIRGDTDAAARELALSRAELARSPEQVFLKRAVEIHAGHLDLARARSAAESGDAQASERLIAEARARLDDQGFAQSDVRFARRLLERAIGGWIAPRPEASWKIHETGLWFEPPYGARVELGRKHALRRLLVGLARQHVEGDRAPLPAGELINTGWPGERIQKHAAANRLRVALHTLRRLGLNDLLVTHADGYHLDPSAALEIVAS